MKIFSIHDKKSGYEQTFNMPNEQIAIRAFIETCKDKNSTIAKYPEDFELVEIAEFNQENGKITGYEQPKTIANATMFVEKTEK